MKKFIVVAFYTSDYENHAKRLERSMELYNIPFHLQRVIDLGSWIKNVNYKPIFIREMMDVYDGKCIVYVDVDAEFQKFPDLFDKLEFNTIALHQFDRSKWYGRKNDGFEVLSGTIFLNNTKSAKRLVDKWIEECRNTPNTWDQKSLQKVVNGRFYRLPETYCKIFDTMATVKDSVITHYQASRSFRRRGNKIKREVNQ